MSVLFDRVQCHVKSFILSAHLMLLRFETFCTNQLHYDKFMECGVLCVSEFSTDATSRSSSLLLDKHTLWYFWSHQRDQIQRYIYYI